MAALAVENCLSDPACDKLLAQQLAALPEDRLAGVLDAIAVLDRSLHHHALPHILKCVQQLGNGPIWRFREALGLVSLQTCEAALVHAEIS